MEKKTYKQVLLETLETIVKRNNDDEEDSCPGIYRLASFCMSVSAIIMHTYNCNTMGKLNFDIEEYGKLLTSISLPAGLYRANIETFMNWLLNTEADISDGSKWAQLPDIAEIFNQYVTGKRED